MRKRAINDGAVNVSEMDRPDLLSKHGALTALKGTGVVYAMRVADGVIKIGHTANIAWRIYNLHGEILGFTIGSLADEQALHAALSAHIHHGREWYHPTPEVLAVVAEMREELGLPPLVP